MQAGTANFFNCCVLVYLYCFIVLCHMTVRLPSSYQIPSSTVTGRRGVHFVYNYDYILK